MSTYILEYTSQYMACSNFVVSLLYFKFSRGVRNEKHEFSRFLISQSAICAKIKIVSTEMRRGIYWKVN